MPTRIYRSSRIKLTVETDLKLMSYAPRKAASPKAYREGAETLGEMLSLLRSQKK